MSILNITKATDIASHVAQRSEMNHKLGAVLFDKTQYVTGWNRGYGVTLHSYKKEWSLHAENMVLIKGERAGIDFPNSTMVVVRINRRGTLRVSKPCDSCARMIERFSVRTVYYVG